MKLYYSPGACSLSPHIALREAGLAFELARVDLKTKQVAHNGSYDKINPKGYVPALMLENGETLTEGPAIVQFIADQVPASRLAPPPGTLARYQLMAWLNFISTELHKSFGAFFKPNTPDAWKTVVRQNLTQRCHYLAGELGGNSCLMGEQFTVADAYLFTVLRWAPMLEFDLATWPVLNAYVERIAARPAVRAAMQAEGLLGSK